MVRTMCSQHLFHLLLIPKRLVLSVKITAMNQFRKNKSVKIFLSKTPYLKPYLFFFLQNKTSKPRVKNHLTEHQTDQSSHWNSNPHTSLNELLNIEAIGLIKKLQSSWPNSWLLFSICKDCWYWLFLWPDIFSFIKSNFPQCIDIFQMQLTHMQKKY